MDNSVVKALDTLSGAATPSGSVAEAIGKLDGLVVSDGAAAVTAALGPTGDITVAIAAAIPQSTAQADSEATTAEGLVADFNALLAKLRTAGIMAD